MEQGELNQSAQLQVLNGRGNHSSRQEEGMGVGYASNKTVLGEVHTCISKLKSIAPHYFSPQVVEGIIRSALQASTSTPSRPSEPGTPHPYKNHEYHSKQQQIKNSSNSQVSTQQVTTKQSRRRGRPSIQNTPFVTPASPAQIKHYRHSALAYISSLTRPEPIPVTGPEIEGLIEYFLVELQGFVKHFFPKAHRNTSEKIQAQTRAYLMNCRGFVESAVRARLIRCIKAMFGLEGSPVVKGQMKDLYHELLQRAERAVAANPPEKKGRGGRKQREGEAGGKRQYTIKPRQELLGRWNEQRQALLVSCYLNMSCFNDVRQHYMQHFPEDRQLASAQVLKSVLFKFMRASLNRIINYPQHHPEHEVPQLKHLFDDRVKMILSMTRGHALRKQLLDMYQCRRYDCETIREVIQRINVYLEKEEALGMALFKEHSDDPRIQRMRRKPNRLAMSEKGKARTYYHRGEDRHAVLGASRVVIGEAARERLIEEWVDEEVGGSEASQ